jgi:hypothetical protein
LRHYTESATAEQSAADAAQKLEVACGELESVRASLAAAESGAGAADDAFDFDTSADIGRTPRESEAYTAGFGPTPRESEGFYTASIGPTPRESSAMSVSGRGRHSSTHRLNASTFYGICCTGLGFRIQVFQCFSIAVTKERLRLICEVDEC